MPYFRPLLVVLTLSVVVGCGGATSGTPRNQEPPPEDEKMDAATPPINEPPPRLDAAVSVSQIGERCAAGTQCRSGFCVDGVCCDSDCKGSCKKCDLPGTIGECRSVDEGEDPDNECAKDPVAGCKRDGMCDGAGACRKFYAEGTECAAAMCTGSTESSNRTCNGSGMCSAPTTKACTAGCVNGICPAPCGPVNPCQAGLYCDPTTVCKPKKAAGQSCTTADECTNGNCIDGVCCNTACTGNCQACTVPGFVGTCVPVPVGQDPKNQCPADLAAPCGRAGGCDGMGACRFQALGTPCGGGMTCSGTTESQRSCNGTGTCVSTNPRSCVPFRCSTGGACGVSCFTNGDCAPGNTCNGGACDGGGNVMGGELLHWAFDETSNGDLIAQDTSGNGNDGSYTGNGGNVPTNSTNVPVIGVFNARSRTFDNAQRETVRLAQFSQNLRPVNDVTVSAWYRANTVDTNGADIVSAGDTYLLRLRTGSIEFSKRITTTGGGGGTAVCRVTVNGHLNNQWHHIAGVTTSNGMVLYFDGREVCSNNRGEELRYDRGNDFWVGRHGFNEQTWDFEGQIDDVRVFGRELTADDIRAIAGSTPGAADIVMHWKLDETSTTTATALDASGNQYNGTYTGNGGNLPAPDTAVAPIGVVNPRSRVFDRDQREAIRDTGMPAAVKPRSDLTVSAWYRANSIDGAGSEILSAGNNYLLRLRAGSIEFSKRTSTGPNGTGTRLWVECRHVLNNHLNNQWHHIAGVTSPDGMYLYFDGVEVCNNAEGGDIIYDQGNDMWVGRHGNNDADWDFEGNIDDVRVYGRALSANEIMDLVGVTQPAELLLQWRFDETSTGTTTALDSSGSNLNGFYTGSTGFPPPQTDVPQTTAANNPRSRGFTRANRHSVRLQPMPQSLRLVNELSVSAWYRSATVEDQGEEIISAGNSYLLRVRNGVVEFAKRTAGGFQQCVAPFAQALDNQWHHVVGVTSAAGLQVFVDGQQLCNNALGDSIVYDQGQDFWVGRHGNTQQNWDFEGSIDDVRVYSRALTDGDVNAIYSGQM